jgi:hypothetical protein
MIHKHFRAIRAYFSAAEVFGTPFVAVEVGASSVLVCMFALGAGTGEALGDEIGSLA